MSVGSDAKVWDIELDPSQQVFPAPEESLGAERNGQDTEAALHSSPAVDAREETSGANLLTEVRISEDSLREGLTHLIQMAIAFFSPLGSFDTFNEQSPCRDPAETHQGGWHILPIFRQQLKEGMYAVGGRQAVHRGSAKQASGRHRAGREKNVSTLSCQVLHS